LELKVIARSDGREGVGRGRGGLVLGPRG